jgi:flavin-dependent dehydrogenase
MTERERALPHVVIVGGGFGGLTAARVLRKTPVRVTLIDRSNHHLFQPLRYQVATAMLPAILRRPFAETQDFVRAFAKISLPELPVTQPVNKRQDLRHRLVNLGGNFLVQIEAGKNLQKILVFTHGDIVLAC